MMMMMMMNRRRLSVEIISKEMVGIGIPIYM